MNAKPAPYLTFTRADGTPDREAFEAYFRVLDKARKEAAAEERKRLGEKDARGTTT